MHSIPQAIDGDQARSQATANAVDGYNPDIWISYTTAWRGKPTPDAHARAEGKAAGIWRAKATTPRRVMETVTTDGYAFCARLTGPKRSRATFAALHLAAVDFDGTAIDDVLDRYPLARDHASFAYATASHKPEYPRCRLVFCLAEPITDAGEAGDLLAALAYHFAGERPDASVCQAERIWYGAPGKLGVWIGEALGRREVEELLTALRASPGYAPKPQAGPPDSERVAHNLAKARRVLDYAGLAYAAPEPYDGGYRLKLAECPYNPEDAPHGNDGSAVVIVHSDGRIAAMCQHNRCARRIEESGATGWALLKHLTGYDGAARSNVNAPASVNGNGATAPASVNGDGGATAPAARGLPTSAEYVDALARMGYTFAECETDGSIEVRGQPLDDGLAAQLRCQLRDAGYSRVAHAEDAYRAEARRNLYHPVRRWLDTLTWDGRDHMAAMTRYLTVRRDLIDGDPPLQVWLRYWMVNAVGRCYVQRQNVVLVLDGAQGIGKSTWARWLCPRPDWHHEGPIDPHDRELYRTLATKLVWEVNELGATMRRADQDALKAILSQEAVTYRAPYARNPVTRPTLVNFIGTVNDIAGFLSDATGHRRFVALPVERIDHAYREALDVGQLWAQAGHYWRKGLHTERTPAMRAAQAATNEDYEISDAFAAHIASICTLTGDASDQITALELLHRLQAAGLREASPRATEMRIGTACTLLGLTRRRASVNGARQTVYGGAVLRP